jgi:hypothetical protein
VLYKALNNFYYVLYDPSRKAAPYFPVGIIITLGLINIFLLAMFNIPCAQVFKKLKEDLSKNIVTSETILEAEEKPAVALFGITNEMIETIKVLLAILGPLLSGIFS